MKTKFWTLTTPGTVTLALVALVYAQAFLPGGHLTARDLGGIVASVVGTFGCSSIAAKRDRNEWFALWGFCGLFGWLGVSLFLKDKAANPLELIP